VELGVSPSAVSQAVRQLEARVGTPLFTRTTRSVSLTEAGERYLSRVLPAVEDVAAASEEIVGIGEQPLGLLRLNVSRAAYLFALLPVLPAFQAAYPGIELDIAIDSALVDIVRLGFDAGIRYGDMVDRDMVGVRVGPLQSTRAFASPAYLARRGTPLQPKDLAAHDCIRFRSSTTRRMDRWLFARGKTRIDLAVTGPLVLNDDAAIVEAAVAGAGIGYLASGYIDHRVAAGELVHLLGDWCPPMPSLTMYYPTRRRVPRKLAVLIELLRKHHARDPKADRQRPGRRGARAS
jgi:DNA-binding transcriptional LysR family regulator